MLSTLLLVPYALLAYKIVRYIYRLTLHPLAKFPGPKLAGVTSLYGAYYDLVKNGEYCKKWIELHEEYGPIVRIFPNTLQVHDMESYHEVFRIGTQFDKDASFYSNPVAEGSHLQIAPLAPAKARKDMFLPFFSKAAIRRLEPTIQFHVSRFVDLMSRCGSRDEIVNLNIAFRSLTIDIITDYCWEKPTGAMDAKGFRDPLVESMLTLNVNARFEKYIPWLGRVAHDFMMDLPRTWVETMSPEIGKIRGFLEQLAAQVQDLKTKAKYSEKCQDERTSIFDIMLHPDTSKGQYTPSDHDLNSEALLMVGAGSDTTANTLCVGTWHLLNDHTRLDILRKELNSVMPRKDSVADMGTLEGLPYLRAVVKESLRLSYGSPGRSPRIVPSSGQMVCGKMIPPGTTVTHAHYVYHHDESIFPDSHSFRPERFIGSPQHETEMDKRMLSFSRGSRSCLGMNLALAELYLTFAHVFRKLDLRIAGTTKEDMDWSDNHVVVMNGKLQVKVNDCEDK